MGAKDYDMTQYSGDDVAELLNQVDEKRIYNEATPEQHGLMGAGDKDKLDGIIPITNAELAELFNEILGN